MLCCSSDGYIYIYKVACLSVGDGKAAWWASRSRWRLLNFRRKFDNIWLELRSQDLELFGSRVFFKFRGTFF